MKRCGVNYSKFYSGSQTVILGYNMSDVTKRELRKHLQEKLESISLADENATSSQVLQEIQSLLEEKPHVSSVLLYRPMKMWHELDLSSLPDMLPNIHFDFVQNAKDAPFPEKKYDVIVIPLFGFNKVGYRLGHGGGWYDCFLITQPQALKIGVGYENTLVNFAPEPHDVRVDLIVTDSLVRTLKSE